MKTLLIIAMSLLSLTVLAQEDTLHYQGSTIVENVDGEWISNEVEFIPDFKVFRKDDKKAYLYLKIGDNKPIVDGEVEILTDLETDKFRTLGFISNDSGPCMLRLYNDSNLALFHFDPDFETETMKSYIVMNKVNY